MKAAARKLNFEQAAALRENLRALRHLQEPVTFRALRADDVQGRLENSQAVQALQKALGLPRLPLRIEAFDISHVQGAETVASLVVFEKGIAKKSDYRKFIIKTVTGVDDFASMREVVGRRYRRLEREGTAWPDLILIDGGPGQLSAALEALKEVSGKRQAIASLAKEEEEIYLPDRPQPLRLAKDSPALQLLQRVRDESHRFAIACHRKKHGKSLLS
jgi:excinuclease ABC subunit C